MICYSNKYILIILLLVTFYQPSVFANNNIFQTSTDTINRTDSAGLKQGFWIIYQNDGSKIQEKGLYKNNKKNGVWINFYSNGNTKSKITYNNGSPSGYATFFYENGKISEQGNWQKDHWVGPYKYYYESGQLSYDWNYDTSGKRTGEQIYYHANGEKKYEGKWEKGKNQGSLKVYNEKGNLIEEKIYANGKLTESKKIDVQEKNEEPTKNEIPKLKFSQTGNHTIFNDNGTIDVKGYFVNGYLYEGEKFTYNKDGKLLYVTYYKNGKKAGTKNY